MVTGHRPMDLTLEQVAFAKRALKGVAKQLKRDHGMVEAISGMALGADTWWARIALKLEVDLAAYIPYVIQPDRWPKSDQDIWHTLRARSSRERIFGESFSIKYLFARNSGMISDCDLAIAVWDPSRNTGGTAAAVKEIRRKDKPMILIDLETLKISRERF